MNVAATGFGKKPGAPGAPEPAAAAVAPTRAAAGPEIYVYYRARPEDGEALVAAALPMQRGLRSAWPGLGARLLRRPELREGLATWMEAYALPLDADPDDVARSVERAAAALAPWLASPRHVEHFVDGEAGVGLSAAAPGRA